MNEERPLHGVAAYNPDLLSKDELVRTFVARHAELHRLLDALRRESDGVPQHHLLIARRGMGKTTLLRRLRYAIEDDEILSKTWLGLTFPEEQYNVADLSDFWLNCLDALADALQASGQETRLAQLDAAVARIHGETDEARRETEALSLLLSQAADMERRLVLLVDNVDLVLDRLKKQEWSLRNLLSEEPRLLLIGATSAGLESGYDYQAAFYDFFRVHVMQGLNDDETFELLRRLAEVGGDDAVLELLDRDPGRIRTTRVLAGGNPRTIVLLYGLLAQGVQGDVRTDLERLLDQYTPLYKHRIEQLPELAQRVVDGLAVNWHPMTAAELSKAIRLDVNTTSSQLNRLYKSGVVEKVGLPDTKRLGFQIAERFFNIWYLMRTSRRVRQRLTWLVEFLRLMYGPDELGRLGHGLLPEDDTLALGSHPTPGHPAHTLARTLSSAGSWPDAANHARTFLASPDFIDHAWPAVLRFYAEVVARGFVAEARALLDELGLVNRLQPLDHALRMVEADDPSGLQRLAPEVRRATELVLEEIAPNFNND